MAELARRGEVNRAPAIAANNFEVEASMEARRRRVLLAENPEFRYAVVTDTDAEPGVVVHIGIRGTGSGEILIAKGSYDGIQLLRLLENRRAEDQGGKEKA
jgi:hypothetical protein